MFSCSHTFLLAQTIPDEVARAQRLRALLSIRYGSNGARAHWSGTAEMGPLSQALPATGTMPVSILDFTTPTSLAKTYLNSLHAPHKAFATIDGAGHFAVFTKQDVFLKELRARVLPLIR